MEDFRAFKAPELRLHTSIKECSLIPTELMLRHEAEQLNFLFSTYFCFQFVQHKQIKLP